jgi:hypothetical protein
MKKVAFLFSFILFSFFALNSQGKNISWDYPVKPGSAKWQQFKSIDEMHEACQIPEDILKKLSTESLVQICADYPAYFDLFIYNTPQAGFESYYSYFNGICELLSRKDVGHFMLKKYASMSLTKDFNSKWELKKQGEFVYKQEYFEILLAQPQVIQSLNSEDRKLLLKEAIKKFDEKQTRGDLFGGSTLAVNAWILGRILYEEGKLLTEFSKKSDVELSFNSGQMMDYNFETIYQQAKSFINE